MLQMEAEGQTEPVELESKRLKAGDITLDVVAKLGEHKAVALWLKVRRHCSDETNEHRQENIVQSTVKCCHTTACAKDDDRSSCLHTHNTTWPVIVTQNMASNSNTEHGQ